MDPELLRAICKIEPRVKGGKRGTGCLIAPDIVLTALHVVANRSPQKVEAHEYIEISLGNFKTTAEVIPQGFSGELDFALLRLKEQYPSSVRTLELAELVDEDRSQFESFGYPNARPEGLVISGRIEGCRLPYEQVEAMQLYSDQVASDIGLLADGLSGGPVLVDGKVVGVIAHSLQRQDESGVKRSVAGTIYATSVKSIANSANRVLTELGIRVLPPDTEDDAFSFVRFLQGIHEKDQDWPSWSALEKAQIWIDKEKLETSENLLRDDKLVYFVGPQGGGKTSLVRTLAHRVHRDYWIEQWDFEAISEIENRQNLLSALRERARKRNRQPMLVLENIHCSPKPAMEVIALCVHPPSIAVAATSRVGVEHDAFKQGAPAIREKLKRSTIDLSSTLTDRGQAIVNWWFKNRGTSNADISRAWYSAPWTEFIHDLWVLRLALESYDWETFSLPAWSIHKWCRKRLAVVINEFDGKGADDLLYVIAGLGRHDLATDLEAAARMLDMELSLVKKIAKVGMTEGILRYDQEKRDARYWHASLANLYWQTFGLHRDEWAQNARKKLATKAAP